MLKQKGLKQHSKKIATSKKSLYLPLDTKDVSCIKIIYKNIGMLDQKAKEKLFKKHGKNEKDTGSAEGQIALFTERINHLTEHLKKNRKDYNTERSLVMLVGKRRSLLDYLTKKDVLRYRAIVKELGLRK